jgi:hypothetical protein
MMCELVEYTPNNGTNNRTRVGKFVYTYDTLLHVSSNRVDCTVSSLVQYVVVYLNSPQRSKLLSPVRAPSDRHQHISCPEIIHIFVRFSPLSNVVGVTCLHWFLYIFMFIFCRVILYFY